MSALLLVTGWLLLLGVAGLLEAACRRWPAFGEWLERVADRVFGDDMYSTVGRCSNCGMRFRVSSRRGEKVPLGVECWNCGVVVRDWATLT